MSDRGGDPDAAITGIPLSERFSQLYTEYRSVILMAAYRRLGDLQDAQDVTTEVFRVAWSHRNNADYVFELAWLYATLRNLVGNEYRRRDRAARLVDRLGSMGRSDSADHSSDDALVIREAVAALSPQDRELIGMVFWDETTREEAAQVLGCSVNAVNLRLQRVRRKLFDRVVSAEVAR